MTEQQFISLLDSHQQVIGQKFGRWTILDIHQGSHHKPKRATCRCECGTVRSVVLSTLYHGKSHSCGCYQKEKMAQVQTKHGNAKTRLYYVWKGMRERCLSPANKSFPNYGGRGIQVCAEWRDSFSAFQSWALASGYLPGLTIERRDNSGDYCPENCQWATHKANARNRRITLAMTAFGESKSLGEWAEDPRCVVSYDTLHNRVMCLMLPPEIALTTPSGTLPHAPQPVIIPPAP